MVPSPRRHLLSAVALSALLLVAGASCSGGADKALGRPTSSDSTDPCSLLTARRIDAITGWTVADGARAKGHEAEGQAVCNWESADTGAAVQVQVHDGAGRALFDQRRRETTAAGLGTGDDVTVRGAEAAFAVPDHGVVTMLVGRDVVQVMALGDPLPADAPAELAAAAAKASS